LINHHRITPARGPASSTVKNKHIWSPAIRALFVAAGSSHRSSDWYLSIRDVRAGAEAEKWLYRQRDGSTSDRLRIR
jgi:hypothetical protein